MNSNTINGPGLIIVKASLKYQWKQEVSKFSDLKATVIQTYSEITSNITNRIKTRESKEKKTEELKEEIKQLKKERSQLFKNQFKGYDLLESKNNTRDFSHEIHFWKYSKSIGKLVDRNSFETIQQRH